MKTQTIQFTFTITATHDQFVKAYNVLSAQAAGHFVASQQKVDNTDTAIDLLGQVIDTIGATLSDQEVADAHERVKQAAASFINLFPEN